LGRRLSAIIPARINAKLKAPGFTVLPASRFGQAIASMIVSAVIRTL
jgi:hypothetical protein